MKLKKYVLKSSENAVGHPAGTVAYETLGYDYGCANDDYRVTGREHISLTLDSKGDYPFFTVPVDQIEEVG